MINIDSDKAIFLAPIEEIKKAFLSDLKIRVHNLEKEGRYSRHYSGYNRTAIVFFTENLSEVARSFDEKSFQTLISTCHGAGRIQKHTGRKGEGTTSAQAFYDLVGLSKPTFSAKVDATFKRVLKLICLSLWSKGLIILPKLFIQVTLPSDQVVEIAQATPAPYLYKALVANPSSKLDFPGLVSEKLRKNASNHWLRLILNTNWTKKENITEDDLRQLIENSRGSKHAPLSRYYVNDLLVYLFKDDEDILEMYRGVLSEITQKNEESHRKSRYDAGRRNSVDWFKKSIKHTPTAKKGDEELELLLDYYYGDSDENISSLFGKFTNQTMRRAFHSKKLNVQEHPLYSKLDSKVKNLVEVFYHTFEAFTESRRVVKLSPFRFDNGFLLSYVSIYLPRFFMRRDGNLSEFPTNLNEFTCAYFVVRNEHLSALLKDQKEPPLTFFKYVELYADQFDWAWQTGTYAHLKRFQLYFEFLEKSSSTIPNAEKFKSTVSDRDIPQTTRRSTTNKNLIPRRYFKVFLSLLESLEYLVDHINGMADGVNLGMVDGKLVSPTYAELATSTHWISLFGFRGGYGSEYKGKIDSATLNYTPIVLFEGSYYPIEKIRRFYTLTKYRVNGVDEQRATPHVPRILWLMANTGIRQQHLIWLDKDSFDAAVTSKLGALAPLIVNTDKAHDEWVSIVSKDVIDLCRRQREWLERNELESLRAPMWYMDSDKHRFGKFIPLFRLDTGISSWDTHDETGTIMWIMESFLKHQVGDSECPRLAFWKPSAVRKVPGKATDHIMGIDEFERENVNLSWNWKLYSKYTPHGLRASFVSEHMRFLPPSLIGRHLTGQFSESLVWYYTIMNAEDIGDHQQLLINLLMKNEEKIKNGGAPDLAEKISNINKIIAKDIDTDPTNAISTHGLFSLSDMDDSKNGIAELKAKQTTRLAFNPTHICPFNNVCPAEVVKKFGLGKPCTICPYAIRGVMHLPALNAEKFKCVEMMEEYGAKIKVYKKRPETGVIQSEIEGLEAEYDQLARDAFALEAIEQQLYHMRGADNQPYIAQDSQTIKDLYETLELDEGAHLIKRLIDVQIFGDLDSPKIQRKFAHLRYKLIMKSGDLEALLEDYEEPENVLLASQLHSMMSANELTVKDVYNIATTNISSQMDDRPALPQLGFDKLNPDVPEGVESE